MEPDEHDGKIMLLCFVSSNYSDNFLIRRLHRQIYILFSSCNI